ncbi:hypothetical protein SSX86_010156 [Deinandra increscens subsp. villosa]|uniref:Cystatin domain-containing protein n=1 Tax=Deinandra increscens subsp. villosa TaxID=3103831 RepID=A0AAP0D707_9ASTR
MHNNLFTTTILILFFFSNYSAAHDGIGCGRWKPMLNITNPWVVDIGKFAVHEHNKQDHASIKFVKLLKGEQVEAIGTFYNLTIKTTNGSVDTTCWTLVCDDPFVQVRRLVLFKWF